MRFDELPIGEFFYNGFNQLCLKINNADVFVNENVFNFFLNDTDWYNRDMSIQPTLVMSLRRLKYGSN